jgi:hypothetical protein
MFSHAFSNWNILCRRSNPARLSSALLAEANPSRGVRARTNREMSFLVLILTEEFTSRPIRKTQTKTNLCSLGLFWVTNVALESNRLMINIDNDAKKADQEHQFSFESSIAIDIKTIISFLIRM